ncbi:protein O-mannosyltransferase 1 [Trichogramma pretiosum]|uniref:protein O-mannosyltransferase 1 n=1 Tax=Trichogramma pretiosum TaxID=7493 RepID=UPI0006C9A2AB|nr:protein O-mannosyltransferase 1 [Trichogramma pretiosum]
MEVRKRNNNDASNKARGEARQAAAAAAATTADFSAAEFIDREKVRRNGIKNDSAKNRSNEQTHAKKADESSARTENAEERTKTTLDMVKTVDSQEESGFLPKIKINFEIDLVTVLLFVGGILTRFYRLAEPASIVFDELHYGKYVSLYLKKTFFFDSHPPLGKQLIAAAAYLAGFDGQFKFDRIGSPYDDSVPIYALRFIPALCGSLIIPTAYHLALEVGLSQAAAAASALLLLFDNALLTQSRFVLMESILIQFALFGLLCVLRFRKVMKEPGSLAWWFWLATGIFSLTCALCVKYIGFYTLSLALYLIIRDYWSLIPRKQGVSSLKLYYHLAARVLTIGSVMTAVYLGVFYVHLSSLTKAGPHDFAMTSAFQASLEGGLASITKGQPIEVTHGSQITLRHTHGRACWLHSHDFVYPLRYPDKRGSSHQQQVTCYSFKDVNNWWIVKRPEIDDLVVSAPSQPIKHGDVIQLVHGITSRALNSHDVAAPMTPQCQEVSCYVDYNVSMPAQNLWRVEIVSREVSGDVWHAIKSQVRLIHLNTTSALKFSGKQLPDWGFNQHEVVADRMTDQIDAIWNVEEHRYTKNEDQKDRERELLNAEMIPLQETRLSFWEKFVELQTKMLLGGVDSQTTHMYSSSPIEWPFTTRGIAYWVSPKNNAQVHLLGNVAIWYSATIAVALYFCLFVFYIMRRRRLCYDLTEREWARFVSYGEVLFVGYLMHYLPFFFVERTMFLHHYLPAFVFKVLLTAAVADHIYNFIRTRCSKIFSHLCLVTILFWLGYCVYVFKKFSVLNYGVTPLTSKEILKLRWSDEWDFIIHKK